ncbi:DUF58 domain-containing protein [Kaarinaea lacus]
MALIRTLTNPFVQRFRLHRFSLQRFFVGEGPETGPIHLVQRRVYILPTKRGLFFLVIAMVMLIGALNYNNSLAYSLTFLLASLGIIAILHTYRNLLHLKIDVGPISPVFCGDHVHVPLILDNHQHPARYSVRVHFPSHPEENVVMTDVPENHWIRVEPTLPTHARGRYRLDRVTLRSIFPLGMFQVWAHAQLEASYLVYPSPEDRHSLPQESLYHFNQSGDRGKGTDDFAGLRPYHQGDSLRHVHWKTFAREQGLHTKQFGGDRAEELWLDWDTLNDLDVEARLSRLTRWVLDADSQYFNYGLRLPNQVVPLGHGPVHKHQCLEALALYPDGRQV